MIKGAYHPRVIVSVGSIGPSFQIVEHSGRLHLLTECHEIRLFSLLEPPFFVRPESTSCTNAGLNFIDNEESTMFLSDKT